jgi:hypothetical protein
MLISAKLGADFSRGCAHPATRLRILATHPPIRELTLANTDRLIGRHEALNHKLAYVVVVEVVYAVDVLQPAVPAPSTTVNGRPSAKLARQAANC